MKPSPQESLMVVFVSQAERANSKEMVIDIELVNR
jgi:hypothetical protein